MDFEVNMTEDRNIRELCEQIARSGERDCLAIAAGIKERFPAAIVFCMHSHSDCLENYVRVNDREYTHHFAVLLDNRVWDAMHGVLGESVSEYCNRVQCRDVEVTPLSVREIKPFDKCPKGCKGCLRSKRIV